MSQQRVACPSKVKMFSHSACASGLSPSVGLPQYRHAKYHLASEQHGDSCSHMLLLLHCFSV